MRLLLLLAVLSIAASITAGCGRSTKRAAIDYETIDKTIHRDTEVARAKNLEAGTLLEAGRLDDAESLLKQALSADVMFGPAHNNLGKVHFERGKLYEAAWEFQQAIQLMPHQPEPRNNLGLVLEKAGRVNEAVASFDEALKLEPGNPQLIGNLARAKVRRGDRDDKLRQLLSDLILKDTRPEWTTWARERLSRMLASEVPAEAEPISSEASP